MKPWKIGVIVTFIVAIAVGAAWYANTATSSVKASQEVVDQAEFEVILPESLPSGDKVATEPYYDSETATVTTRYEANDGGEIVTSQQKRPAENPDQIDTQDRYLVNAGSVYVLKGEPGRLQAIVVTSDSWLLVNASAEVSPAELKLFTERLVAP